MAEGLSFLPGVLTAEYAAKRSAAKDTLTEILVADLGDLIHKSPHLLVRNAVNDLAIYQPFHYTPSSTSEAFTQGLRWLKVGQPVLAKYSEEPALETAQSNLGLQKQLIPLANVGGYTTVAQLGTSPSLVLKETRSSPKVISLRERAVKAVATWNSEGVERGIALLDADGELKLCELPSGFRYDTGWAVKQVKLGQDVESICYHAEKGVYMIGLSETLVFKLPDDDYHHEWAKEGMYNQIWCSLKKRRGLIGNLQIQHSSQRMCRAPYTFFIHQIGVWCLHFHTRPTNRSSAFVHSTSKLPRSTPQSSPSSSSAQLPRAVKI